MKCFAYFCDVRNRHRTFMDGWKIVWSSWNTQDVYMAKNYLEANGVECVLQDELTTQTSYYANAIGGAKLLVMEEAVKEAVRLLVEGGYVDEEDCEPDGEVVDVPERADTDKERCPFCGSFHVGREKCPDVAAAILGVVLRRWLPLFQRPYRCFDCKKMWRFVKESKK